MGGHERLFLAEDSNGLRRTLVRELRYDGHEIVFEAGDLDTALKGAEQAKALGVTAAVLDGNFTESDHSCEDGFSVARALRQQIPDLPIIAYTSEGQKAGYGNVFVDKSDIDSFGKLTSALARIEHPA